MAAGAPRCRPPTFGGSARAAPTSSRTASRSPTVHWLFDRYLISLTNDYRLLVAHNRVPAELRALFERQLDRIHLPRDERLWPHATYVERHREVFLAA